MSSENTNTATEKNSVQSDKTQSPKNKKRREKTRKTNLEFFSKDFLGKSKRNIFTRPVTLNSIVAKKIYRLTYERMDAYLYRPKEFNQQFKNPLVASSTKQVMGQIEKRLSELENYVDARYQKVKRLYDQSTEFQKYEIQSTNSFKVDSGFSTGFSNRFLAVIEKIDDTAIMANYLEIVGIFSPNQEDNVTSDLYKKVVTTSRILMKFIARYVFALRKNMGQTKN